MADNIEPISHLEKVITGNAEPISHLEQIIALYGGTGGSGGSGTTKYEKENVYIYKGGKWELFSGQLIAA